MDNEQPAASSSSTGLPSAIHTNRFTSAPSLPTPELDGSSFLEDFISRTSFSDDFGPVEGYSKEVQNLEKKKASLDKELQDLQKRLEDAEKKKVELEKVEKRRSAGAGGLLSGSGVDRTVSAGGSR